MIPIRHASAQGLRKPVIYSAIFHLVIFTTLFAFPGLYLPLKDRPMRIDVQWVELPKGTGEDIDFGVQKSEGLPKSTIEEQKQQFQPEPVPPKQSTLAPEMKAPPPVEKPPEEKAPVKAKAEPKPQIDTSKMKITDKSSKPVKSTPTANRKIRDALAMIDKDLKGRQVVPEAGQVGSSGKGYKYGTSDKPLRVSPSDPEYIKYQAMVRGKIIRAWVVPSVYTDESGKRYSTTIVVMINMDGEVTSANFSKMSGNSSFDSSAKRAVLNASPFPRPPDRIVWEATNEGFGIEFRP